MWLWWQLWQHGWTKSSAPRLKGSRCQQDWWRWPQPAGALHEQSRFQIIPHGGIVRGQALTDIGETKFEPILEWIKQTDTEVVLLCIPRANGPLFIKQANKLGLLNRLTFAWIGFNELHHQVLNSEEREKVITCSSFVMSDDKREALKFIKILSSFIVI